MTTQIVKVEKPQYLIDLPANDTRGNEEVSAQDSLYARVMLAQQMSPCRSKNKPEYIEGIEEGHFYNNLTRKIYGNTVTVCPVYFTKQHLIWVNRDKGGGFKGAYTTLPEAKLALSELERPQDHSIVETAIHYCLILTDEGGCEEAIFSLSKTGLAPSKKLNSLVRQKEGMPRFAGVYSFTSFLASNPKGDFWNFDVRSLGYAPEDIYLKAEQAYLQITKGEASIDHTYEAQQEKPPVVAAEYVDSDY